VVQTNMKFISQALSLHASGTVMSPKPTARRNMSTDITLTWSECMENPTGIKVKDNVHSLCV
jgi:hypothetical protein